MGSLTLEPIETVVERPVETALQQVRPPEKADPMMEMLASAVSSGNLELVKELYAFKKQVEEDEAKRAYVDAMAAFKREPVIVTKDKENKQYGSRYTSISNLVNTLNPELSKHGLSAEWEIDQTSGIRVTCVMTHRQGYSKRFPLTVPPDTSGAKNPLQQIKSSITYAKIATYEAACGIASSEANLDDDGNGSGSKPHMPEEDVLARMDAIAAATDNSQLQDFYLKSLKAARDLGDKCAEDQLVKAKNKRYRELNGGSR